MIFVFTRINRRLDFHKENVSVKSRQRHTLSKVHFHYSMNRLRAVLLTFLLTNKITTLEYISCSDV